MSLERMTEIADRLPSHHSIRGIELYDTLLDRVSEMLTELYRRLSIREPQLIQEEEVQELAYLLARLHREMGDIFDAAALLNITEPEEFAVIERMLDGSITSEAYEELHERIIYLGALCLALLRGDANPLFLDGARQYVHDTLAILDDPGGEIATPFGPITMPARTQPEIPGYYLG